MQNSFPRIGVGAVIWRGPELLLIRRDKPPRAGEWSIPGGRQERGETVRAALLREVREETGLEVAIIGLVDVVDAIFPADTGGPSDHYTLIDFSARWRRGQARAASDAAALAWVEFKNLSQFDMWSETRRVIEKSARLHGPLAEDQTASD
jgi:ADP-ribose pyrophosphatase YjhB (NUDIX family)